MKGFLQKFTLLIVLLSVVTVNAKTKFFNADNFISKNKFNTTQTLQKKYNEFSINLNEANQVFQNKTNQSLVIENFPISLNAKGTLSLIKVKSCIDEETEVYIVGNGKETRGSIPIIDSYTGTINGYENSFVFLTYTNDGFIGTLRINDEEYNFSYTAANTNNNAIHTISPTDKSIFEKYNVKSCGTNTEDFTTNVVKEKNNSIQANKLVEINLAVEANYEFFALMKLDTNKAKNYMVACIDYSSRIYEKEVNVFLKIGSMFLYIDEIDDPYVNVSGRDFDLQDRLTFMPSVWKGSKKTNIVRTFSVLFADIKVQPSNSVIAGIANGGEPKTGNFCSKDRGYAVFGINGNASFPTLNYNQDAITAAHEIGHLFGCPHTHSCAWPSIDGGTIIDSCYTSGLDASASDAACLKIADRRARIGTIMSYCHTVGGGGVLPTFGPRQIAIMKTAIAKSYAGGCLKDPILSKLRLMTPLGGESLRGGSSENIAWASAKVDTINIYFSTNAGVNWTFIAGAKSSRDSIYKWDVPKTTMNTVWIKIEDANNPATFDQSLFFFKIAPKFALITAPTEGQRVGFKTKFFITWTKTLVTSVNIDLSTNSGANWITIVPTNSALSTSEVKFPEFTGEAWLKITDPSDNSFDIRKFKLEKDSISFVSPRTGDVICDTNSKFAFWWDNNLTNNISILWTNDNWASSKKTSVGIVDANRGTVNWNNSPWVPSDCYKIRAVNFIDNSIIYGETNCFKIDNCITGVFNDMTNNENFKISDVSPNPVSNILNVKISNKIGTKNLNAKIVSTNGETVLNFGALSFNENISLDLSQLFSGTYMLVIEAGDYISAKSIQIVK